MILDPSIFLSDDDISEIAVNTVVKKDKRSECEKSMFKKNNIVSCTCPERVLPEDFNEEKWEEIYDMLIRLR